ncbi:hypothetical protein SLS62_002130 [Diatrype stigma]|uniref:Glucose-methanol-choline oxidoreductase N-terminal domain-containing protein n=1 Tax=Diatrype stigma TaxID=117547 RepID=A0AAN9UUM1_9PEZI
MPSRDGWDYIIVGGGVAGCVVAHRLRQYSASYSARILLVEAGPDASTDEDILYFKSLEFGSEYDWKYKTAPQKNYDGRQINFPSGRALGGGSVINGCGWIRGARADYDHWSELVGDPRWRYENQLPYFKLTERWSSPLTEAHGQDGKFQIQSPTSTGRLFPLADKLEQAWKEMGVNVLPDYDMNGGDNLGLGELNENRSGGARQITSLAYPLDGITVLTDTLVEKIILIEERDDDDDDDEATSKRAVGIRAADGTEYYGKEIICCAGALRTPQLLMLSGIGPAGLLRQHGIGVHVDLPGVGRGLNDHAMLFLNWRLRDPSQGYALGSANPTFREPRYAAGMPASFVACTTVPREGLRAAIAKDEGAVVDADVDADHYLLRYTYGMMETVFVYIPAPPLEADGTHISCLMMGMKPTSRGTVSIASRDPADPPVIDPNYFDTEVDRYVWRTSLRKVASMVTGENTVLGREIIAGETPPEGFAPLSSDATDEYLDARVKAAGTTTFHPSSSCAMGEVVDTELRVKGVRNLRVVDASVFPISIGAHLQAAVYALAEQAAVILSEEAKAKSSQ